MDINISLTSLTHCPVCSKKKSRKQPACKNCIKEYQNQIIGKTNFPTLEGWVDQKVNERNQRFGMCG